ncbi:hypothetical protein [uncultured Jatrophihabitans sp.]|uniref:hypothetical protein n=1 Tax=uncultured Jatrophihabitans sp. TaxID=1610747 RepID=UPI0035CAFD00
MPTAPTAYRFQTVRGRTLRLTKLDQCGNPVGGAGASYVTQSFVTLKAAKNMDNGNEIKQNRADDTVDLFLKGQNSLLDFDMEIDFSANDTAALPLLSGDAAVLDWQNAVSGWEEQSGVPSAAAFALELWTGVAGQCAGTNQRYGYWLYPFITNAYVDVDDIDNGAKQFMIKANTQVGNAWGKGPYTVVAGDTSNTPSRLLQPMSASAHRHFEVTTIAPPAPTAAAGLASLTLPTPY